MTAETGEASVPTLSQEKKFAAPEQTLNSLACIYVEPSYDYTL